MNRTETLVSQLMSEDKAMRRSALQQFVSRRISFDNVKLSILIDVMRHMTGCEDNTLDETLRALNEYMNQQLKPLYGTMMTEKRETTQ